MSGTVIQTTYGYAVTQAAQTYANFLQNSGSNQYYWNDSISVTGPVGITNTAAPNTEQASDTETSPSEPTATTETALLTAFGSNPTMYTVPVPVEVKSTSPGEASTEVTAYGYSDAKVGNSLSSVIDLNGVGNAEVTDSPTVGNFITSDLDDQVFTRMSSLADQDYTETNVVLGSTTALIRLVGSMQLSTTPEDPSAYPDGRLPQAPGGPDTPDYGAEVSLNIEISGGSYDQNFGLYTSGAQYQDTVVYDENGNVISSGNFSAGQLTLGNLEFTMTGLPVGVPLTVAVTFSAGISGSSLTPGESVIGMYNYALDMSGLASVDQTTCYLRGTQIATPGGEVSVERLSAGDEVVTLTGVRRRIVWIGMGRVVATRGQRNAATPVIVRKGALAPNVPHQDLRVTKGHSLFLDDVLIPVEFLVNHRSILWDDRAQEVTVYHLELDTHDVLLANGAPAESYRDDGNRWLFQNANSGWDLPPKAPCAPVLTGGPIVDAVWRRLLDRAGPRPGAPLTDDPDLHILVDGVRLDAGLQTGDFYIFNLRHAPTEVRLASRAGRPQELGLSRDPRCLGVAVRRIVVRQRAKFRKFEAVDKRLVEGFHAFEAGEGFRWTDGDALLPPEMFAGLAGPIEIVLHIGATAQYIKGAVASRAA